MGKISFLDNPFGADAPRPSKARALIEGYIERLIAALDALDGDADDGNADEDFEPDSDDEPSIGGGSYGYHVDLELDTADDEPGMGWSEATDQSGIGDINTWATQEEA